MTGLEQSILAAISYYDILDTPLTLLEIYQYAFNPKQNDADIKQKNAEILLRNNAINNNIITLTFSDFQKTMNESLILRQKISNLWGFYFLAGREKLANQRIIRDLLLDQKWKKLSSILKWLKFIPFLELTLVSGSMAVGNIKQSSDFDLIMAIKKGRVWTGRFLAIILFEILGVRRQGHIHHPDESQDKICLYHFITESSYANCPRNIYWANIYKKLICVFGAPEQQKKFFKENAWVDDYFLVNHSFIQRSRHKRAEISTRSSLFVIILEKFLQTKPGDFLEKILKSYQSLRIQKSLQKTPSSGRVVFNDEELEFVPIVSKETKIMNEYQLRFNALLNKKTDLTE